MANPCAVHCNISLYDMLSQYKFISYRLGAESQAIVGSGRRRGSVGKSDFNGERKCICDRSAAAKILVFDDAKSGRTIFTMII